MPYRDKEDRNRYMRDYRRRKKAEREAEKLRPGLEEFKRKVEAEKREGKKENGKPLPPPKGFDDSELVHISSKDYQKGVDEAFKVLEEFEPDEQPEPVKPRPSNVAKIRDGLFPSEIQWLKDHPGVAEGRESGLLYDKPGRDSKSYTMDKNGNLTEVKEEEKKDLIWRF